MKFDYTPFIHGAIAVACQLIVWIVFANPWLGALLACTWWIAREHTQAEYRWITAFAQGNAQTCLSGVGLTLVSGTWQVCLTS